MISLQPFLLRKLVLIVAALLFFSALCFADSVFMARQYAGPVATAAAFEAKQPSAHLQSKQGAPPVEIAGALTAVAPTEIGLWQSPAGATDLLFLQLKSFTLFDANPDTASDLARFQ